MNYQLDSDTFYSNQGQMSPNAAIQNPPQNTNQTSNQNTNQQTNQPQTFRQAINIFLNSKTGTILTAAIGLCIGFAFKDLINGIVTNIIQPIIFKIIVKLDTNNYFNLQQILTDNNNVLDFSKFACTFITFLLIVLSLYYVNKYISVLA
jgi:large-conductance mechanosensitive channel